MGKKIKSLKFYEHEKITENDWSNLVEFINHYYGELLKSNLIAHDYMTEVKNFYTAYEKAIAFEAKEVYFRKIQIFFYMKILNKYYDHASYVNSKDFKKTCKTLLSKLYSKTPGDVISALWAYYELINDLEVFFKDFNYEGESNGVIYSEEDISKINKAKEYFVNLSGRENIQENIIKDNKMLNSQNIINLYNFDNMLTLIELANGYKIFNGVINEEYNIEYMTKPEEKFYFINYKKTVKGNLSRKSNLLMETNHRFFSTGFDITLLIPYSHRDFNKITVKLLEFIANNLKEFDNVEKIIRQLESLAHNSISWGETTKTYKTILNEDFIEFMEKNFTLVFLRDTVNNTLYSFSETINNPYPINKKISDVQKLFFIYLLYFNLKDLSNASLKIIQEKFWNYELNRDVVDMDDLIILHEDFIRSCNLIHEYEKDDKSMPFDWLLEFSK